MVWAAAVTLTPSVAVTSAVAAALLYAALHVPSAALVHTAAAAVIVLGADAAASLHSFPPQVPSATACAAAASCDRTAAALEAVATVTSSPSSPHHLPHSQPLQACLLAHVCVSNAAGVARADVQRSSAAATSCALSLSMNAPLLHCCCPHATCALSAATIAPLP